MIEKIKRGQVSTELLTILAVVVVFLGVLFVLYQAQSMSIIKAKQEAEAKNELADLSAAAKEVYAQGYGAKKQVYVNVPSGIVPEDTYVFNKSIRINIDGSDYIQQENFDLRGTLPTSPGGHFVWVTSEGNRVRIGYAMIDLDKQVILITMRPNETKTAVFRITNVWASDINVSLSDKWYHDDVAFSIDDYFSELAISSSQNFVATFASDEDALGIYVSEINMISQDALGNVEYVELPIVLQVTPDPSLRPPLVVLPPLFNATINRSESASREFQICTNTFTSVSSVDFTASVEEPGVWASGLGSLGALGPDTCVNKVITITVPDNAFYSNYTGFIKVDGQGNPEAKDSIALLITVGGGGDNEGPDVVNITTGERRVHEFQKTTIHAVADDNLTGGSNIRGCKISVDNTETFAMFPSDGRFDNQTEPIHYVYYDGFATGYHVARLNCTDELGNIGPTREFNFTIGKHILFVIASGNESDWSDWIDTYEYRSSYPWTHDIANFDDVLSGAVNLWYYDTVIFLDWSGNDEFVDLINEYHDLGGFVGLFGESAHKAVRDLGVAWHPDNPHPETHVNIIDNTHYVTEWISTTGLMEISSVNTKTYALWWDYEDTKLGTSGHFYPSEDRTVLAEVNRTMFWGVNDPWRLNDNGIEITARVIDYMINQSLVD